MFAVTAASAQDVPQVVTPLREEPDVNGVNLTNGKMKISPPTLSVPGAPHLKFDFVQNATPYVSGKIPANGFDSPRSSQYAVHYGGSASEGFGCMDYDCSSVTGSGSTFRETGLVYKQAGTGAVYRFSNVAFRTTTTPQTVLAYLGTVTYPDGETLSYTYDTAVLPGTNYVYFRATRIDDNLGFYITITYQPGALGDMGWNTPAQVTIYNSADPSTPLGRLTYNGDTITDIAGRVFTCAGGCNNYLGNNEEVLAGSMQLPGEASPAVQASSDANGRFVTSVVKDGVPWTYTYANPQFDGTAPDHWYYSSVTVDGPNNYHTAYGMKVSNKRNVLTQVTDSLLRTTKFTFDGSFRLTNITYPELNSVSVLYDDFGNITSKTTTPKPGSGQSATTETAFYPTATCTEGVLCYRPTWVRDALGRQTDFLYNSSGQLTEQTDPADNNGVRRKTYVQYDSTTGISRKSVVRVCGDVATCGTVNEIRTEYDYWGNTTLPSTERRIDGAAGTTLTTTYTYDNAGRLLIVDGPLAGTDDTTYYRYDILGRKTWEIGPKGANGLRDATHVTYRDSDDKPIVTETGTIADPNNPTLLEIKRIDMGYDSRRNPTRETLSASGTVFGVTDRSYDDRGRMVCEARRMNPPAFGTIVDGCSLGAQGSDGPDRITHNDYDAANQLLTVQRAYLTPLQQNYARYEYTPNGKQKAVIDANNNRAEMAYDGFDRLRRWVFPVSTSVGSGVANQADYEEYGYDAVGNRLTLRKRDNVTITYDYDGMNRMWRKTVPASATGAAGYSVYYGYDVRGLQASALFGSATGPGITNAWDGLGRLTSTTSTMDGTARTLTYHYDAHGNRTDILGQFGFTYDASDRMTLVTSNNVLVESFAYDTAGRRQDLRTQWSTMVSASTHYDYDPIGRLQNLTLDLAGTASDRTLTFGYNAASQILSRSSNNDAYAADTPSTVSRGYGVNGLNQYSGFANNGVSAASFTYDANGNLNSDGSTNYVYDAENRLVSASGLNNATLSYDPLGRLWQVAAPSKTTRFLYDGDHVFEEIDGAGNVVDSYIFGPGADELLVWWELVGGTWVRRHAYADHQGSVVAVTDGLGNKVQINGYDAWGVPNALNVGRFQYTGQMFIPELGLYYYKARFYSSRLGRFLQIDPIGYKDQINLYSYVGNDPVDGRDPSGTCDTGSRLGESSQCRVAEGYSERRVIGKLQPGPETLGYATSARKFIRSDQVQGRGPHFYDFFAPACRQGTRGCSASSVFETWRHHSAPGAPYAQEGKRDIDLTGGNPITQHVDPDTMSIFNETRSGHAFNYGTVLIRVETRDGMVGARVTGMGAFGRNAAENQMFGPVIFHWEANQVSASLKPYSDFTPPPYVPANR